MVKKTIAFFRTNTAALIIGASLIIAINFGRFVDWVDYAAYVLSGQASADREAKKQQEEFWERQRVKAEQDQAQAQQEQVAAQRRFEKEEAANQQRVNDVIATWQEYLISVKGKYRQIQIVQDQTHGDYVCLLDHPKTGDPIEQVDEQLRLMLTNEQYRAMQSRQRAAFWNYKTQDNIADGFVGWLNSHSTAGKRDWSYGDLKGFEYGFYSYQSRIDIWNPCLSPKELWRANRYQNHIE